MPEIFFISPLNWYGLFHEGLDRVLDPGSTTFSPQGDDISIVPPSQWAPLQFNSLGEWAFQAGQYYGATFDGYLNVPGGGDVTFDLLCGNALCRLDVNGEKLFEHLGGPIQENPLCDPTPPHVCHPVAEGLRKSAKSGDTIHKSDRGWDAGYPCPPHRSRRALLNSGDTILISTAAKLAFLGVTYSRQPDSAARPPPAAPRPARG